MPLLSLSAPKFGGAERTVGDTTLLPAPHLTFVGLTLGKFTDGVGVLLIWNRLFRGCAEI